LSEAEEKRWLDVSRIVFFNDAVFAISMTVLVFGFRVPEGLTGDTEDELASILRDQVPDLAGYFVSFAVLAYYWVAHHRLFDHVRRADRWVLYLNLAFLSFIALLPFPAELVQHYGDTVAATVLFSANIALAGLLFTALQLHAARGHRLIDPASEVSVRHGILRTECVWIVFAASIPVALASPAAGKLVWLLVPLGHVVLRLRFGSVHDAH
jgi:uncharacterized membrane protein